MVNKNVLYLKCIVILKKSMVILLYAFLENLAVFSLRWIKQHCKESSLTLDNVKHLWPWPAFQGRWWNFKFRVQGDLQCQQSSVAPGPVVYSLDFSMNSWGLAVKLQNQFTNWRHILRNVFQAGSQSFSTEQTSSNVLWSRVLKLWGKLWTVSFVQWK